MAIVGLQRKPEETVLSRLARLREEMVELQIARRGISDVRLLGAMREVPRERFVAPELAEFAYEDAPLGIGQGQTISQPYMVAEMIAAAEIGSADRVLEVGAGSGYAAAVISRKMPVFGPPLWYWPVECRYRGPTPYVVAIVPRVSSAARRRSMTAARPGCAGR